MDDGGALNSIAQSHPSYMNPFGFYDIESIQAGRTIIWRV